MQLIRISRLFGRGFAAPTGSHMPAKTLIGVSPLWLRPQNALWKMHKNWTQLAETLLALGYIDTRVLRDFGSAKITFDRVRRTGTGHSEGHMPSSELPDARDTGIKASLISNKLSLWIHVRSSYSTRCIYLR